MKDDFKPQNVICRDQYGFFVECVAGGKKMRSHYFQTHEQAREEQKRISAFLNADKLNADKLNAED